MGKERNGFLEDNGKTEVMGSEICVNQVDIVNLQ